MPRHSKIPKKNRKKLKSVDPFNKKGNLVRQRELEKKNLAPKEQDEQEMPKNLLEIGKARSELAIQKAIPTFPKKKTKIKSHLEREAARYGYEKKPLETKNMFIARIEKETRAQVTDITMKAKYDLAGRAKEEIDKDYAEIDAKIERRRELKRKRSEKILALKKAKNGEAESSDSGEEEETQELKQISQTPLVKESSKSATKIQRKEDAKTAKQLEKAAIKKEALLTAKEYVPFGERYDAPPKFDFDSKLKMDMAKRMAKAGSKNLMLKSLLNGPAEKKTVYNENKELPKKGNSKLTEADRQRVIEMYRENKRLKRLQQQQQQQIEEV